MAFLFINQDHFNTLKITTERGKGEKPIFSTLCQQSCVKHLVAIIKKIIIFLSSTL